MEASYHKSCWWTDQQLLYYYKFAAVVIEFPSSPNNDDDSIIKNIGQWLPCIGALIKVQYSSMLPTVVGHVHLSKILLQKLAVGKADLHNHEQFFPHG